MPKKTVPNEPIERPQPGKVPEQPAPADPEEPLIPTENPDIIPEEDPFETPPYEVPEPGEAP